MKNQVLPKILLSEYRKWDKLFVFLFGVELETDIMGAACLYWTEYFPLASVQILNDNESCCVCLFWPGKIPFAGGQRNTGDLLGARLSRPKLLVFVLVVVNYDVMSARVYYLVRVLVLEHVVLKVTPVTEYVLHLYYLLQSLHFILVILIRCLNYYNIISFPFL